MLLSEDLTSLLSNIGQLRALKNAENIVNDKGIQCATYARFFLNGHPYNLKSINFNQRDTIFIELASELTIVDTNYYVSSKIAQSPALINLAR